MKNLSFLKHTEINKAKWDTLIDKYAQGLPYAYSWYLDAVCENWNVIIYKDYEAGFAFQINYKYGLPYSLNPFLVQQLGFLGKDENIFSDILHLINSKVFHYHYHLFYFNNYSKNIYKTAINHELELNNSHEKILSEFNTNTKRNLKKAYNNNLTVTIEKELRPKDITFIGNYSKVEFNSDRMQKFQNLMFNATKNEALEIYKVESENELIAMVIFIRNPKRAVYLMAISNKLGKELKANFLIVNEFIKNNINSSIVLDFEGSNISGIARFYAGFGAKEINYNIIKSNSSKNILKKIFN